MVQTVRAEIISQKLKPGQPIREDELAVRFNVSRTPVREMLRRLEQEDLIHIIPNRGAFVSELTTEDIEEVLDIRMALEVPAAGSAALKMNERQVAELREISRQLDLAVKEQDSIISFEADSRLHNLILAAAGNNRAHRIINNLMGQIQRIRFISAYVPGRLNTTVGEQKRLIAALLKRQPQKAEKAMETHLQHTKKLILPPPEMQKRFEEFVRTSLSL